MARPFRIAIPLPMAVNIVATIPAPNMVSPCKLTSQYGRRHASHMAATQESKAMTGASCCNCLPHMEKPIRSPIISAVSKVIERQPNVLVIGYGLSKAHAKSD